MYKMSLSPRPKPYKPKDFLGGQFLVDYFIFILKQNRGLKNVLLFNGLPLILLLVKTSGNNVQYSPLFACNGCNGDVDSQSVCVRICQLV